MRSLLFPAAFLLLTLAGGAALAQNGNSGAALSIYPDGLRIPVVTVPQPDSGALVLLVDTRDATANYYAQRVNRHGKPLLGSGGVYIAPFDLNGTLQSSVADGFGGVILAESVPRGATGKDIVLQRVMPDGTLGFGASGIVICSASGDQTNPRLVAGPTGFVYVVWNDLRAASGGQQDVYAQKVSVVGSPQWTANGIPVNAAGFRPWSYGLAEVCGDLQGGLVVTWTYNSYGGPYRAQRINSAGSPLWTATGVAFGDASYGAQGIVPDGTGGIWGYVSTWDGTYSRFYAYRLLSSGSPAFAGGVLYNDPVYNGQSALIRSATGGCFIFTLVSYQNQTGVTRTINRQELGPTGALLRGQSGEAFMTSTNAPFIADVGSSYLLCNIEYPYSSSKARLRIQRYGFDGTAMLPGNGIQLGRADGTWGESALGFVSMALSSTGVIVAGWTDGRYATPNDQLAFQAFGQALTPTGTPLWDDAELPGIVAARDAAADQGGHVRVTWNASVADDPGAHSAHAYRVWRALPDGALANFGASRPGSDGVFRAGERTLLSLANTYWELAGEQPAVRLPSYAMTVATMQDSMAGSPADQSFMVEAVDDSSHHWFSGALTGHSVDNLPPGALPTAAGLYSLGTTSLYWGGVSDADLCCYEVFRGSGPGFTPSDANRIASTTQVTWNDPYGGPAFYRIAATDIHGNRGPSSLVTPAGILAVDGGAPREWRLHSGWNGRALELAVDVPQADDGHIDVFDISGRRLWGTEFHTQAAEALSFRATPAAGFHTGIVYARVSSASGRQLVAKSIVLR